MKYYIRTIKKQQLLFILLFLLFHFNIIGQKVNCGHMAYGLLDYSLEKEGVMDSTMLHTMYKSSSKSMPDDYYFSNDYLVTIYNENLPGGEKSIRNVFEFKTQINYKFVEGSNPFFKYNVYYIDTLDLNNEKVPKAIEMYRKELDVKKFNLTVDSVLYSLESEYGGKNHIISAIETSDIILPFNFPTIIHFGKKFVISYTSSIMDALVTIGIKSFSSKIEPSDEIFSISLEGYENGKKIAKEILRESEEDGID